MFIVLTNLSSHQVGGSAPVNTEKRSRLFSTKLLFVRQVHRQLHSWGQHGPQVLLQSLLRRRVQNGLQDASCLATVVKDTCLRVRCLRGDAHVPRTPPNTGHTCKDGSALRTPSLDLCCVDTTVSVSMDTVQFTSRQSWPKVCPCYGSGNPPTNCAFAHMEMRRRGGSRGRAGLLNQNLDPPRGVVFQKPK